MKIICFLTIALLSVLAAAVCGCIHSAPVPDDVKSSAPGFGSSKQAPYGAPVTFPSGISVVGKPHWDQNCFDEAAKQGHIFGNGTEQFCIQFTNNNKATSTITVPAGSVFISENTDYPNSLIVKTIQFTIPPVSSVSLHFLATSINQSRKNAGRQASFDPRPIVAEQEAISELATLLANKKVNAEDYGGEIPTSAVSLPIQEAVHEIAHTGKISVGSREKLSKLPGL